MKMEKGVNKWICGAVKAQEDGKAVNGEAEYSQK